MTGKQSAVMWLGFLLIVVRLFTTNQWDSLWSAFGTKEVKKQPADNEGGGSATTPLAPSAPAGGIPTSPQLIV